MSSPAVHDRSLAAALALFGFALGAVIFLPYRHGAAFIEDEFVYLLAPGAHGGPRLPSLAPGGRLPSLEIRLLSPVSQ